MFRFFSIALSRPFSRLVGGEEQNRGDNQTDADSEKIVREQSLHLVLEAQAHDSDRNHRHDKLQDIIRLIIEFELEESFQQIPDDMPEYDYRTEDGSEMNRYRKIEKVLRIDAEQFPENHEMSAAADRQKFRKSLNDTE